MNAVEAVEVYPTFGSSLALLNYPSNFPKVTSRIGATLMLTTGVDIIEIPRIQRVLQLYGSRFLGKIFTQGEIDYCRGRAPNLAGRFAAKEATMKALGTGVRGVGWKDIEVIRHPSGAPSIKLHGRAEARAQRLAVQEISVSITHSRENAMAFVVAQCESAS